MPGYKYVRINRESGSTFDVSQRTRQVEQEKSIKIRADIISPATTTYDLFENIALLKFRLIYQIIFRRNA